MSYNTSARIWAADEDEDLEVRELRRIQTLSQEYENALRTHSYIEFWRTIQSYAGTVISDGDSAEHPGGGDGELRRRPGSSFRILAASLFQPDEEEVISLLHSNIHRQDVHDLLKDYFDYSLDSSDICGALLKSIYRSRDRHKKLEVALSRSGSRNSKEAQQVLESLRAYREAETLFSIDLFERFEVLRGRYKETEQRLRVMQQTLGKKLRRARVWSKVANVALTPVLGLLLLTTLSCALLAYPVTPDDSQVFTRPVRDFEDWIEHQTHKRENKLEIQDGQLDVASKGTFVISAHLATIQRLVTRSMDEVEVLKGIIRFYEQRRDYNISVEGVVQQLKTRQELFAQHMTDLEEHVILFFLSLNRARGLVIQKINRG